MNLNERMSIDNATLACDADLDNLDNLPYPLAILIKYDGVRVLHKGGCFGRSMDLHKNPWLQELCRKPEWYGFDSEGIVGDPSAPNCISVTSGAFSRQKDNKKKGTTVKVDVKFYVFDDFSHPGGYIERHANAARRVAEILEKDPSAPLIMVPYTIVNNKEELLALEEKALAENHEGLIGRSLNGRYKQGRCTPKENFYLRFKRFEEREFIIEGFEEGFRNENEATLGADGHTKRSTAKGNMVPNGQIGAFLGTDVKTKQPVKVAAGRLTVAEAIEGFKNFDELYKGKIGKYQVFAKGTGGFNKPRFPTFQSLRSKEDM